MHVLARYLARQALAPTALAGALLTGLVTLLQLLRVGHHLLRADLGWSETALLVGCCLPTVLVLVLPIALPVGLLWTFLLLRSRGELEGMRAAGARHRQLAAAPALLVALVSLSTFSTAKWIEPAALARLAPNVARLASQTIARDLARGGMISISDHTAIRVDRPTPHCPAGSNCGSNVVALTDDPPQVLTADRLQAHAREDGRVDLRVSHGQLLLAPRNNRHVHRLRFGRLDQTIDIHTRLARQFAYLGQQQPPYHALDALLACVTLGGAALLIGLGGTEPSPSVIYGGAVIVAHLALAQLGRILLPALPSGVWGLSLLGGWLAVAIAIHRRRAARGVARTFT